MTHSSWVEHISFPAQMQDHFISSGKRSERNTLINHFLALSVLVSHVSVL